MPIEEDLKRRALMPISQKGMNWRGLVLISFCLTTLCAAQSDRRDVEQTLLALERVGKLQATELKDLKMLNEILDEKFSWVDPSGKLQDKTQFLNFAQNATSVRYVITEIIVKPHGDTAIVTGVYRLSGLLGGKQISQRARFIDTWQIKESHWRIIASLATPIE